MKSLKSKSSERFTEICLSYLLFGIFIIKKWVEFIVTSFGTLKYGCETKAIETFNFLPLIID